MSVQKVKVRRALPVAGQSAETGGSFGLWLRGSDLPPGYTRLVDTPEVIACVRFIAGLIGSMTIKVMENGKDGDRRVRDSFSRFIDVTPCRELGTRMRWMSWIVTEMLISRDGTAFVLPQTRDGELHDLLPMPGAVPMSKGLWPEWCVSWRGHEFSADDVLCFANGATPDEPWRGLGLRVGLDAVSKSLGHTSAAKTNLSDPTYMPPMVIAVDGDSDLADESKKAEFLKSYVDSQQTGKPWVIPGNLMKIESMRPLSISDIAIKDNIELDRKAVCSMLGVPGFVLGVSNFSVDEYNGRIETTVRPLALEIQQALTNGLILSPKRYVLLDVKSLYRYNLRDIVSIYKDLGAMGYVTGNEVRNQLNLEPMAELNELKLLENYIPAAMSGEQKKLIQKEEKDNADE